MYDKFDICEAFNLLAHDWGLYDVKSRLDDMGFRCARSAEFYDGLSDNGRDIYDYHDARLKSGTSPIRTQFS